MFVGAGVEVAAAEPNRRNISDHTAGTARNYAEPCSIEILFSKMPCLCILDYGHKFT